jgi:hypothetical protein
MRNLLRPRLSTSAQTFSYLPIVRGEHILMEYEPLRRAVGFPKDVEMQEVVMTWDRVKLGGLLAQIQKARKELLLE